MFGKRLKERNKKLSSRIAELEKLLFLHPGLYEVTVEEGGLQCTCCEDSVGYANHRVLTMGGLTIVSEGAAHCCRSCGN